MEIGAAVKEREREREREGEKEREKKRERREKEREREGTCPKFQSDINFVTATKMRLFCCLKFPRKF
jgi:hypothetical protein